MAGLAAAANSVALPLGVQAMALAKGLTAHRKDRWLATHPNCALCVKLGKLIKAVDVDVFNDRLMSLCDRHRGQFYGYVDDVGLNGMPIDPRHPINCMSRGSPHSNKGSCCD